jgi:hypothetical protein
MRRSDLPKFPKAPIHEATIESTPARLFNAWTIPEYAEAWYGNLSLASVRADIDLSLVVIIQFEVDTDKNQDSSGTCIAAPTFHTSTSSSFR